MLSPRPRPAHDDPSIFSRAADSDGKWAVWCERGCYVAVCNNYAICNKLQTALNCNAVCNTSYFKLRCEGNAICDVLQIASKFYHLKILKRRKKILINCKIHRFNNILLWIQLDSNLFALGMQNSKSTLHLVRTLFCPRTFANFFFGGGGGIKTHLSVRVLVCLSVPLSVTQTLTWLISSEVYKI